MTLDLPFWIRQRQVKVDELSTGCYKVTGPNLQEGVVSIRIGDNLHWKAAVQGKANGPEIASTDFAFQSPRDALAAAFELYREKCVV